jgi:hypothetical protein
MNLASALSAVRRLWGGEPAKQHPEVITLTEAHFKTGDTTVIAERPSTGPMDRDVVVTMRDSMGDRIGRQLRGSGTLELKDLVNGKYDHVYVITKDNYFCFSDRRRLDDGIVLADARASASTRQDDAALSTATLRIGDPFSSESFLTGGRASKEAPPILEIVATYVRRSDIRNLKEGDISDAALNFVRMAAGMAQ